MLKKKMSSLRIAALGLAASASLMAAQQAVAEVEVAASAAVASAYLWRGTDLGGGSPAVSGDITVSTAGAYAGIWGSSGDSALGSEYDLFVGYGGSIEDFSFDISLWAYTYPGNDELDTFGDASDLVISLGFGPATFTYYDSLQDGRAYYTLSAGYEQFTGLVGYHDEAGDDDTYTHIDLSYAYNDNLSFTLSKIVDLDDGSTMASDDDTLFVVSYSLPIEVK